jgi:hypothetical protein
MGCTLKARAAGCAAAALVFVAAPTPAAAQAWPPHKGEGTVSVLFTNVASKDHFLPDRRYDFGQIDANTLLADVTYGITDRVAITFGVPLVTSRYRGTAPHRPVTLDDGKWHTTPQDVRFNVRYNVVRGLLMVTPFIGTDVPSRDYEFYAHAAPGRALKELYAGASVGRLFAELGLVVQGRYALNISEGVLDRPRRYSQLSLEGAYFVTPSLRVLAMTAARIGHTGIDLYPDSGRVLPFEIFMHHDQISRESFTNVGGGAAYSLSDTVDVFGSFTMTVHGRNTHAVNRGISLGVSWSFGDSANKPLMSTDARKRSLIRCVCEKSRS